MTVPARRLVIGTGLAGLLLALGGPLLADSPPDAAPPARAELKDRDRPTTQPQDHSPAFDLRGAAPAVLEELRQSIGRLDEESRQLVEQLNELTRRELGPIILSPEERAERVRQLSDQLTELNAQGGRLAKKTAEQLRLWTQRSSRDITRLVEHARELVEEARNAVEDLEKEPRRSDPPTTAPESLRERLKESEPAFTSEQAERYVRELAPLVEQVAGRKFKRLPAVKLVDRAGARKVLIEELTPQLRVLMPNLDPDDCDDAVETTSEVLSIALLGKYSWKDQTLYMLPGNLMPMLDLNGTDARQAEPVARLIVAHELTHALQDQCIDLGAAIRKVADLDQAMALNATIEGHALFVQDQVGARLKLDEAVVAMSRLISAGKVDDGDFAAGIGSRMFEAQFERIYLGGRDFIAYCHRLGGNERIWQVLAAPPPRTSMIARPETYAPIAPRTVDYAAVLNELDRRFGPGPWKVVNQSVGRIPIEALYQVADHPERKKIIDGIEYAQALTAAGPQPGHIASVSLLVLKDRASADALIDLLAEVVRENIDKARTSPSVKIDQVAIGQVAGVQADHTSRISFTVEVGGARLDQNLIRVCRGNVMVEIMDMGVGLPDRQWVAIVESVFDRYDAAQRGASARPSTTPGAPGPGETPSRLTPPG